jgi:hypothetical protein
VGKLTSYDWQRLGLDQVDFVLSEVTRKAGEPAAIPLDLTAAARTRLEATVQPGNGAASRREEYREALLGLHVNLLVTLTAAKAAYGKAYGLGRALADTTCPHQSADELAASFQRYRIGQIYVWLNELATLFPEHAAHAVAQSLDWWQQAVSAAFTGSPMSTDAIPASYLAGQPGQQPRWTQTLAAVPSRRGLPKQAAPPAMAALVAAVGRQGMLWRAVLEGDKSCTDLLNVTDYLRAGDRLARHYAHMAWQAVRSMPWIILVLLLLLAIVVVVLIAIPGSAVARAATAVAAVGGTLSGIWKMLRTRIAPIAAQLEAPLWGTELNTAAAEAVTVPPVGTPQNPAWEDAFEKEGAGATAAATAGQPAQPAP